MRIVFLSWAAAYGGGEKHLVELIERLDLSQAQPVILCFGIDPYSRVLNDQLKLGIDVATGLVSNSFSRTWSRIRKTKPDRVVFVTSDVGAFPWYTFLAASFVKWMVALDAKKRFYFNLQVCIFAGWIYEAFRLSRERMQRRR
jgi:hypothetical protein